MDNAVITRKQSLTDLPWEVMSSSLRRKFVNGDKITFAKLELKRGCVVAKHSHVNEQLSYIVSGAIKFKLFHESHVDEIILNAEEVLFIPSYVPHEVVAIEDSVNIDFFTPSRSDWQDKEGNSYLRG